MLEYLHQDLFLDTATARHLYHEVAADLPVIDFHTHLPQGEIHENHRFADLWELWLKHDHYKWRLMRACGTDEALITGDAPPEEKFHAFARCLPLAPGNPVHHWAHLELRRVFGIDTTLDQTTASGIWAETRGQLQSDAGLSVRGLLKRFKVELVCTTDDPADCLETHHKLAGGSVKILPTFRPDRFMAIDRPDVFRTAVSELAERCGRDIGSFDDLISALGERHQAFHEAGCRLSDHGLAFCPTLPATDRELAHLFQQAIEGAAVTAAAQEQFAHAILRHTAAWNHEKGWTLQLHLGPLRQVNSVMSSHCGPDSGFDTMGCWPQTEKLIALLDALTREGVLGKTIVYNLSPVESEPICCALQNFQHGPTAGLIQYGPAWWHLDSVRGIRENLEILTSLGALGTSVGMLTDSRSFTSYVRHEYFRRLLCQFVGRAAEAGEFPAKQHFLEQLVSKVAYANAAKWFAWD